MRATTTRHGMALVISLVLAMALLIFGVSFTRSLSDVKPQNPQLLLRAQLDVLAEGLTNYAVLKFKELPSDFYYAYFKANIATPTTSRDLGPITVFQSDVLMRGEIPDPNDPGRNASYTTTYEVLSQKKYTADTLVIRTTAELAGVVREVRRIVHVRRERDL